METTNRKSIFDDLKKYCIFAKDGDCIEVTEWTNGEGYDITISSSSGYKFISLTAGELDAIIYLRESLDYSK